jgi:hypothetical protein
MGCDFFWNAVEPDIINQRKAGWFLESKVCLLNKEGISLEYERYNHTIDGYFLDADDPKLITDPTSLHLIGVTFYHKGSLNFFDQSLDVAQRQFSFIFNNTTCKPPQLITIEVIRDFSKEKYESYKKYFRETPLDPLEKLHAIYRRGGYERMIANEYWFAELLHALKLQFLPKLEASDDYGYFHSVTSEHSQVSDSFSESLCEPELSKFWGLSAGNFK